MKARVWINVAIFALCAQSLASGCEELDSDKTSSLSVILEPEDTIINGLVPGPGVENIKDGWTVNYDKFLAVVGPVELYSATDPTLLAKAPEVYLVDLKKLPAGGIPLWGIQAPGEGRWDFRYSTSVASAQTIAHGSVTPADVTRMAAAGATYEIQGSLQKTGGQSCPPRILAQPGAKQPNGNTAGSNPCYDAPVLRFAFAVNAKTLFGPCEADGVPGVALTSTQEQSAAVTLHGDHIFFNGFPTGDEGGVMRLAQWLADCDLNLDGMVTGGELASIAPLQLHEIDRRYQLGGSPIAPLQNMLQLIAAQLKTQGHFQGEGECAVDGQAHDHGHDHGHGHEYLQAGYGAGGEQG